MTSSPRAANPAVTSFSLWDIAACDLEHPTIQANCSRRMPFVITFAYCPCSLLLPTALFSGRVPCSSTLSKALEVPTTELPLPTFPIRACSKSWCDAARAEAGIVGKFLRERGDVRRHTSSLLLSCPRNQKTDCTYKAMKGRQYVTTLFFVTAHMASWNSKRSLFKYRISFWLEVRLEIMGQKKQALSAELLTDLLRCTKTGQVTSRIW